MENDLANRGEILLYSDDSGKEFVNVVFEDETFWLTQKGMAELFDVKVPAISKHLKNIFLDEELDETMVVSKMEITTPHGAIEGKTQTNEANFYNLDAIIAVGYHVNSKKATRFRQWATKTLKEYIQKGFVLNDEMMKNGRPFGKDYFDELLERIREIRASERRAYQKIADVFEQCSYDYDKNSETTKAFYAFVQNKLHYAVTGKTAAELLSRLNRLVTMFIDYAELMAEDEQLMSMQDWLRETDRFLANNRRQVLDGKGHISREAAVKQVSSIYEEFRKRQDADYISEFDRQTEKYLKGE